MLHATRDMQSASRSIFSPFEAVDSVCSVIIKHCASQLRTLAVRGSAPHTQQDLSADLLASLSNLHTLIVECARLPRIRENIFAYNLDSLFLFKIPESSGPQAIIGSSRNLTRLALDGVTMDPSSFAAYLQLIERNRHSLKYISLLTTHSFPFLQLTRLRILFERMRLGSTVETSHFGSVVVGGFSLELPDIWLEIAANTSLRHLHVVSSNIYDFLGASGLVPAVENGLIKPMEGIYIEGPAVTDRLILRLRRACELQGIHLVTRRNFTL